MELLQKLTLYDLLGYTLPGCILVLICGENIVGGILLTGNDNGGDGVKIFALICFGYVMGNVISECMNWVLRKIGKRQIAYKMMEKFCGDNERIRPALQKAGIIGDDNHSTAFELVKQYNEEMYARIQVDEKYCRIHNYASLELVNKNMILVSAVCTVYFLLRCNICGLLLGVVGVICFSMRWERFYNKKLGYCLAWFLDKYQKE